jgi:hypothetical protein
MRVGEPIAIHHQKPWQRGRPIRLRGWVESLEGERLVVARRFTAPGTAYDGLDAVLRPGDHGLIELRRGAWISRRRYLRRGGALIGDLYNVQTATIFTRTSVRYVDLEVDVVVLPRGEQPVVLRDVDDLERAVARGHIPLGLADLARGLADQLAERLGAVAPGEDVGWALVPDEAVLAALAVAVFLRRFAHPTKPRGTTPDGLPPDD